MSDNMVSIRPTSEEDVGFYQGVYTTTEIETEEKYNIMQTFFFKIVSNF